MRSSKLLLASAAVSLLSGTVAGCMGCGGDRISPTGEELRARFHDQAVHVLDRDTGFVTVPEGFTKAVSAEPTAMLALEVRAILPNGGSDSVRFEVGNLVVQVHEMGADGPGQIVGSAVAYPRAGGTSYWTAVDGGYEEWLHLAEGVATGREPVATWEIEGATLRQAESLIEIVDEEGIPRIRVSAPTAYAPSGRAIEPTIAAHGSTIELWVDAGGEEVFVDPGWVSTGSMINVRAFHTQGARYGRTIQQARAFGAIRENDCISVADCSKRRQDAQEEGIEQERGNEAAPFQFAMND